MRIRKGVTQSELAKKLGISQTHMSNLEHGRVSVNLKVLLRLSHYFSCGVDALLGLTLNTEVKHQEAEDKYTAEELLDILKVLKKQTVSIYFRLAGIRNRVFPKLKCCRQLLSLTGNRASFTFPK